MESTCPDETLRMRGTNLNLCILRAFEDIFSPDLAHSINDLLLRNRILLKHFTKKKNKKKKQTKQF